MVRLKDGNERRLGRNEMSKFGWVAVVMMALGCGQPEVEEPESSDQAVVSVSFAGKACTGTVEFCLAQLDGKGAFSAAPVADVPSVQEACFGQCDTRCAHGATCCGPCVACGDFCMRADGKVKAKKEASTNE